MTFSLLAGAANGLSGTSAWAMLAYLIAGVFFILALRGLSSPATSRTGNRFGMVGMVLAVTTTLITHDIANIIEIAIAIFIGALIGVTVARKIAMTAMPELVAGFHSLVGLAAVVVGLAAWLDPASFGITDAAGQIEVVSRIELGLGIAIGAITFSGSIIAFLKLSGRMSGSPIMLPGRHIINLGTLAAILGLIAAYALSTEAGAGQGYMIIAVTVLAFIIGFLLIIPIGGADMPVVVSMLNSYSGWAAAAMGFTLGNSAMIITGALVGSSGAILSYIMCKAMNRSFISVIAGGFGGDFGRRRQRRTARTAALQTRQRGRCGIYAGTGRKRHHHSRIRHGSGSGTACAARNDRQAEREGRVGEIRHPPRRGTDAGSHERAACRSECAV